MNAVESGWLIGSGGLWGQAPGRQTADGRTADAQTSNSWTRIGAGAFGVAAILRLPEGLLVGTEGGLWLIPAGTDQWVQWHDETLTLVHDLCAAPVGIGVAAASAYGVATAQLDASGAPRWQWLSDAQSVNGRYTNALLVDAGDPRRWLAATEGGVLLTENAGAQWTPSSLSGVAVRALILVDGTFWAGADAGGVWRSADGVDWSRAGRGLEDLPVFCLTRAGDRLLAGTARGVAQGDGEGAWRLGGAPLRVAAVAAARGRWLAGASPGGLWFTEDRGETWQKTGDFQHVRVIEPPEGE